jgi:hypothetical protein
MLILDSTSKRVRVVLGAAHTTTALRCVTSWRDVTTSAFTPGSSLTSTNGTTAVEVAPAPAASTQRIVDHISVYNTDTTSKVVTVSIFDGTTDFVLMRVSLGVDEMLQYVEGAGFSTYNAAGALKTIVTGTANTVSTGWSTNVLASDVINNNAVANTIADVTGLSFPVVTSTRYWFEFLIYYTANATSTGLRYSINGPTTSELAFYVSYPNGTATATGTDNMAEVVVSVYDTPAAATLNNNTIGVAYLRGMVRPTADGNIILRHASEVSSAAITTKAGSIVRYIAV